VLVVDDDRACAGILAEIVRDAAEDASIEIVHDGESALASILRAPPDLLVLDLGLPRMNGLELCMYLRGARVSDRTRIVSVSAGAQPHDVALLHQLGIRNFIRKGERLVEQLDGVVREVLALR
jgi:CheY-like chemotaxis protein